MEKTILAKLKTTYSSLGLGDSVLTALAASLASTGLVTDENVDSVVAAQKSGLEAIQKSNDKRVADALNKAKEDAAKSADSAKAELDKMRKQVEELSGKLTEKEKGNVPPAPTPAPAPASAPSPAPDHDWFKAERDALMAEFEKRIAAVSEGNKTLTETVNALRAENEAMKTAEAQKARAAFINGKAKELGIPEWRVSEGFSISGDATESAITDHLTKVAENIRAQMLPSSGVRTGLGADGKPDPAQVEEIAKRLVLRN